MISGMGMPSSHNRIPLPIPVLPFVFRKESKTKRLVKKFLRAAFPAVGRVCQYGRNAIGTCWVTPVQFAYVECGRP